MSHDELSDDDFNDLDQLDVDTMLADESRDDLWQTPVRCVVHGHKYFRGYCRCGDSNDPLLRLAMARLAMEPV